MKKIVSGILVILPVFYFMFGIMYIPPLIKNIDPFLKGYVTISMLLAFAYLLTIAGKVFNDLKNKEDWSRGL